MRPPRRAAAIAALQARGRFGIRLGLGRTRALLRALGSPERGAARRAHRGHERQGQHPGDGRRRAARRGHARRPDPQAAPGQLPGADRGRWTAHRAVDVRRARRARSLAAADRVERRHGATTEFETLTAPRSSGSRAPGSTSAVVEVGLGGRLDATNAWDGGVAAITNVALDHMEYLGDTIHGHRPREGRHHQARRPGRHGRRRATRCRSSAGGRRPGRGRWPR